MVGNITRLRLIIVFYKQEKSAKQFLVFQETVGFSTEFTALIARFIIDIYNSENFTFVVIVSNSYYQRSIDILAISTFLPTSAFY